MDKNLREKLYKYIKLFGVENFTVEELNRSYRVLAKLNHPDVNRDESSDDRMVIINEGYRFLKEAYEKGILDEFVQEDVYNKKRNPHP